MEVGTVYKWRVLQSVCHMLYFNWFGFCLSCLPESLIGFQTLYINIDLISISLDMERRPWEVAVDPPTKTIVSTFQFLSEKSSLFCNPGSNVELFSWQGGESGRKLRYEDFFDPPEDEGKSRKQKKKVKHQKR